MSLATRYHRLQALDRQRPLTPVEEETMAEVERGLSYDRAHPKRRSVVRWTLNRAVFPLACALALAVVAWVGAAEWWVPLVPFGVRFLVDLAGFVQQSVIPLFTDS